MTYLENIFTHYGVFNFVLKRLERYDRKYKMYPDDLSKHQLESVSLPGDDNR